MKTVGSLPRWLSFRLLPIALLTSCSGEPVVTRLTSESVPSSSVACLTIESEIEVADGLGLLTDVRWLGPEELLVTSVHKGIYRLPLSDSSQFGSPLVPAGRSPGSFFIPALLGVSNEYWSVAAPVYAVGWQRWGESGFELAAFDVVLDIDVFEDRLVVLGAQRSEDGSSYAPDGAIAWMGSLDKKLSDLRPLLYSATGPGARAVDACSLMGIGGTRFLADGSVFVVPGVEPGVYRYSPKGRLMQTWQSEQVGFDSGCGLTDEERDRYALDVLGRRVWGNQRRVVDDVLPLPDAAGILVRSVREETATWELKVLQEDSVRTCQIPLEAPSSVYLHGDADGNRLIFLLFPKLHPEERNREHAPRPRLVTMRYQP